MNGKSTWRYGAPAYPLPANRSPPPAPPGRKCSPHTAQMQVPSVPPPGFTARLPATRVLVRYVVSTATLHIFWWSRS